MLVSSRRSLSYPNTNRLDTADVPRDFATVIAALELDVVFGQGTHASRPAAGAGAPAATGGGRFWWETDTSGLFYDTGTQWIGPINTSGVADGSITLAKLAANSVDATKIVDLSVGTAEIAAGAVTAAKIAAALFPSQGAADGTEALRALGTSAGQAAPGITSVTLFAESIASVGTASTAWADLGSSQGCQLTIPTAGVWEFEFASIPGYVGNPNGIHSSKVGLSINGANPSTYIGRHSNMSGAPIVKRSRQSFAANDVIRLFFQNDDTSQACTSIERWLKAARIS